VSRLGASNRMSNQSAEGLRIFLHQRRRRFYAARRSEARASQHFLPFSSLAAASTHFFSHDSSPSSAVLNQCERASVSATRGDERDLEKIQRREKKSAGDSSAVFPGMPINRSALAIKLKMTAVQKCSFESLTPALDARFRAGEREIQPLGNSPRRQFVDLG
jgi:hypothetical protein